MAARPSGSRSYAEEATQAVRMDSFSVEDGEPAQLAKCHAAIVPRGGARQWSYAQKRSEERSNAPFAPHRSQRPNEMSLQTFPRRRLTTIAFGIDAGRRRAYGIVPLSLSGGDYDVFAGEAVGLEEFAQRLMHDVLDLGTLHFGEDGGGGHIIRGERTRKSVF